MTRTACCLVLALQLCSAATALAGDVTLRKSLEVPVGRAERIEIVNRLGSVKIVARDGARLRVSAIKRAPNPILAERLTVNLERSPRSPDTWSASTYVRRLSPQQSATWHRQAVRIHLRARFELEGDHPDPGDLGQLPTAGAGVLIDHRGV